jgi:hypothetical protein
VVNHTSYHRGYIADLFYRSRLTRRRRICRFSFEMYR